MNTKKQIIGGVLMIIIIVIYYSRDYKSTAVLPVYNSDGGVSIEAEGDYELDMLTTSDDSEDEKQTITTTPRVKFTVPDLNRTISFKDDTSEQVQLIISKNIEKTVGRLKEDNSSYKDWIELGALYKLTEDYEGARIVWEYANSINPKNSLGFRNLGDLYGYYLNNPQKAEENFLSAIQKNPQEIEYYFKISEFYRDSMKDTTKARVIVKNGTISNPNSKELKTLLNSL